MAGDVAATMERCREALAVLAPDDNLGSRRRHRPDGARLVASG